MPPAFEKPEGAFLPSEPQASERAISGCVPRRGLAVAFWLVSCFREAELVPDRTVVESVQEVLERAVRARGAALMAVLNVTPDSFSDGGLFTDPSAARAQIDRFLEEGAEIIDIGPESSRPGSSPVPSELQLTRAEPSLRYALERGALVSIDTTSQAVARACLKMGVHIVNDVSCLGDEDLARVVRDSDAHLILMHSRGSMQSMSFSSYPSDAYKDPVRDVRDEWERARDRAVRAGLHPERIWFDPGLGFHKSAEHSLEILRRLSEFRGLEAPIVVGASRKSFLRGFQGESPARRLGGSIAAALHAVSTGASVLRVHDVHETSQALGVMHALKRGLDA